ncbi:MAG: M50 family metallopeptidase [Saprospiraceae bacterium]|nr:M50 family metallopeptidase [Pyrinomonadaceae bacterium]
MAGYLEFFKRQVVLVHVSGIPVRADYRWFFVFVLMSAITAGSINSLVGNFAGSFLLGLVTTFLFFVSIFLHEFAHAMVAKMEKLEVVEIVLHPFGGLTRFRHEPETPRAEFRIAVAGPAASFIVAVIFVLLMAAANAGGVDILAILLFLLALLNFLIAVFNMLPGYPLDGGRVLRAHLWRSGKDLNEATILTGRCGQVIGVGLIVLGIFIVIARAEFFTGFWAMLAGLFLYDSAKGIIREVRELEQRLVDDVMKLPFALEPDTKLQYFIDEILPLHRRTVFPVAKDRQLYGIFMLEDMKAVAREDWHLTAIRQIMLPIAPDHFVDTGTQLADARELMRMNGIGSVGVIDSEGKLVGFLQGGKTKGKK